MADVIVLGAGMAGVTAARRLKTAGLDVLLLEARQRIGGRIHTLRDLCDAPVEGGAELIHGTRAQTWEDVRAAGLTVRPNSHGLSTMMVDLGDGARWLPLTLLNPQTWPAFGVLRRVRVRRPHDMTAQEFVEGCGYRGRARSLAEMVFTSHLPGRLDEIGINGFLDDGALELETSADYRVNEGYDRLVDHIAHGLNVEFGFEVHTIEWSPKDVALRDAQGRERTARAAISTLSVGVLQSEMIRFKPDLPENKVTALRQLVMGPVLKLTMRFDEQFWPRRLSTLVSATGPVTLYWNVFYKAAHEFPVLTAYCTGPRAETLSGLREDEIITLVEGDLRRHFPRSNSKLIAWRLVDWQRDPYSRGGYTFARPNAADARRRLAAPDTGNLFWAGSETATEPIAATVGGAYASGLRAAREVLGAIRA